MIEKMPTDVDYLKAREESKLFYSSLPEHERKLLEGKLLWENAYNERQVAKFLPELTSGRFQSQGIPGEWVLEAVQTEYISRTNVAKMLEELELKLQIEVATMENDIEPSGAIDRMEYWKDHVTEIKNKVLNH